MKMKNMYNAFSGLLMGAIIAVGLPEIGQAQTETVGANTTRIIDKHNVCRAVANNNGAGIMVPVRTAQEWAVGGNSFLSSKLSGVNIRNCNYRMKDLVSSENGDYCGIDFNKKGWCWSGTFSGDTAAKRTPRRISALPNVQSIAMSSRQTCAADTSGSVWCWSAYSTSDTARKTALNGVKDLQVTYDSLGSNNAGEIACGITLNNRGIRCMATLTLGQVSYTAPAIYLYTAPNNRTITHLKMNGGAGCFVEAGTLRCFKVATKRDFRKTIRNARNAPGNIVDILHASLTDVVVQVSNNRLIGIGYNGEIRFQSFRFNGRGNAPSDADYETASYGYGRGPDYGPTYIRGYTSTNSVLRRDGAWGIGRNTFTDTRGNYYERVSSSFRQTCGIVSSNQVQCRNQSQTGGGTVFGSTAFPAAVTKIAATVDRLPGRPNSLCAMGQFGGVWCRGDGYGSGVKQMQFR